MSLERTAARLFSTTVHSRLLPRLFVTPAFASTRGVAPHSSRRCRRPRRVLHLCAPLMHGAARRSSKRCSASGRLAGGGAWRSGRAQGRCGSHVVGRGLVGWAAAGYCAAAAAGALSRCLGLRGFSMASAHPFGGYTRSKPCPPARASARSHSGWALTPEAPSHQPPPPPLNLVRSAGPWRRVKAVTGRGPGMGPVNNGMASNNSFLQHKKRQAKPAEGSAKRLGLGLSRRVPRARGAADWRGPALLKSAPRARCNGRGAGAAAAAGAGVIGDQTRRAAGGGEPAARRWRRPGHAKMPGRRRLGVGTSGRGETQNGNMDWAQPLSINLGDWGRTIVRCQQSAENGSDAALPRVPGPAARGLAP